jgi:hypothetical protein
MLTLTVIKIELMKSGYTADSTIDIRERKVKNWRREIGNHR